MSESATVKSNPKLRFASDSGEQFPDWTRKKLGDFLDQYQQRVSANTELPIYSSSRSGLQLQREYFADREVANEGQYGVVPRGFFTYRHMSDDSTFRFNINDVEDAIAVSKEYPVFTTRHLESQFLRYLLNFSNDFKRFAIAQKKGGTRTRLYFKNLCKWFPLLPIEEEQRKIAAFLTAVDDKLTILRRKRDLLAEYKRGVMQQLFTQQIRFTRPDGTPFPDWQTKQLGQLAKRRITKNTDDAIGRVLTNSATEGVVDQSTYFKKDIANADNLTGYYVIELGDYVYNPRISVHAPVGPIKKNHLGKGVMSPLYTVFRFKDEQNDFYEQFFRTTIWHRYMHSVANYGARHDRMNITVSDFMALPLPVPAKEEQHKIAAFLMAVDQKITAVDDQISRMETFKKGLLQQMFV